MNAACFKQLFNPTSVAVIGATDEPGHPGQILMQNLLSGTFLGPVMPVHPELATVAGEDCYKTIDTLPLTPELACFCTPLGELPGHIAELSKRGVRAGVALSLGAFRYAGGASQDVKRAVVQACREHDFCLLGPNCLGFMNPGIGLNASLAHRHARPGKVAFVSQSDSLFATVLDWASSKGIGFSHCITLGDRYQIHFGHLLDFLARDANTRAILLYLETITHARAFMSAARATARNKPVLVVKSGRSAEGARAAAAHSGSFLGADDVYDAAFRRAGMLRVFDIDTLFDTVETLARTRPLRGERLAILTNGGSPGFMAADALLLGGGQLARLSAETSHSLTEALGCDWSSANPLVLRSDADADKYATALKLLLNAPEVDAVLVMRVPTSKIPGLEIAKAVAAVSRKTKRNVLTSWLGIDDALESREFFAEAGLPTYDTPEKAIRGFLSMVQYRRNQELLMETPTSLPETYNPDTFHAREVVRNAIDAQGPLLTGPETMEVLKAYSIPVVDMRVDLPVDDDETVVRAAQDLGFPVALKLDSPDIMRKSHMGAVALDLDSPEAVRHAAKTMRERIRAVLPEARLTSFAVQRMMRRAAAHELLVEVVNDPVFGPVIRFGQGGSRTDLAGDRQVALPPLNMHLARELVSRTKVHTLLKGSRDFPGADIDAICLTLCKISQLIIDIPEIFELEINPLFADSRGVFALDAHCSAARADHATGADLLSIRPYPRELEECTTLRDGRQVTLRPIRPEDEPAHYDFLEHVSADDKRFRFFSNIGELPRMEMTKLTQIDYDREMAFIAKGPDRLCGPGESCEIKTLGVVRAMTDPENHDAEFAILIRSDCKRLGLGRILMDKIIRYCRSRGTRRIIGQALFMNNAMAGLAERVGFQVWKDYDDEVYKFELELNPESI